jgi:Xaa-Pro dipeptidase
MDTHDSGGDPNYADKDIMFRYLRKRGTLPERSVITVEPGIYFCKFIIDPYLKDEEKKKYIDEDVLEKYWSVGGVRIEGMCDGIACRECANVLQTMCLLPRMGLRT